MDDYRAAANSCPPVPDFLVPSFPGFLHPVIPSKAGIHSAYPRENGDCGRRRTDCGRLSRCSLLSMLGPRGSGRRRDSPPPLRRAEREMAGAVIPSTASGRPMDEQCGGARDREKRDKAQDGQGMRERRRDAKQVWADATGLDRSRRTGSVGAGRGAAPFAGGVSSSETRPKMTNRFWDAYRASAAPAGGQFDPLQISRRLRNLRKSMFCKRLGGLRADSRSSLFSLKIAKWQFSHHLAMLATSRMSASAETQTAASIGA